MDKRRLLELDEQRRRAEEDKMAAIRALEARSMEFMREKHPRHPPPFFALSLVGRATLSRPTRAEPGAGLDVRALGNTQAAAGTAHCMQ